MKIGSGWVPIYLCLHFGPVEIVVFRNVTDNFL